MTFIKKSTIDFLKNLESNNNKEWFEKKRKIYEEAKNNFMDFNIELIAKLQKMDNSLVGIDPKKTVFRINRDIRFSKDKSPYKTNMGTSISKGGKHMMSGGYYFHLQPGNESFAAAGSYMPMPDRLNAIRQEIDYNYADFKKILNAASFKKYFKDLDVIEKLKTAPKGYSPENPAIEILRHKSFLVSKTYTDKEILSAEFTEELIDCFKASKPFILFLNHAIG